MIFDSNPENYVNDSNIELNWAIKAFKHAEVHLDLLKASPDPRVLKLTPVDDELYAKFKEKFSHLNLEYLTEDDLKSAEQKPIWREFCNEFESIVTDFNMGTLLRLDVKKEYDESNTCIVPRVQFLAIEVTRNRLGLNNDLK